MKRKRSMLIAGRTEMVDLLDFEVFGIDAKIDTGAYSSSIHCDKIQVKEGKLHLTFKKLTKKGQPNKLVFNDFQDSKVKSSNGVVQHRYKIKTSIKLGERIIKTDFTLADRGSMRYPVLLGRKAIKNLFLVDVSKTYLLSTKQQK